VIEEKVGFAAVWRAATELGMVMSFLIDGAVPSPRGEMVAAGPSH
jgi:hypothetical protein